MLLLRGGLKGFGEWAAEIVDSNLPSFIHKVGEETEDAANATDDFANGQYESAGAVDETKDALKAAEDALKDYKDMLDEVSRANEDAMGFMLSFADSANDFADSHADAAEKVLEAQRELSDGIKKHGAGSKEVEDLSTALQDAKNEMSNLFTIFRSRTQSPPPQTIPYVAQ